MLKGTNILFGNESEIYIQTIAELRKLAIATGFQELVVPTIWDQATFIEKAGEDILDKMYAFKDKGDRDICLVPEITAIVQQLYNEGWKKELPKPVKVFYVAKCFRYDRPQMGRYREFTQFGMEILGGDLQANYEVIKEVAKILVNGEFKDSVKRGLTYYTGDGFEIECDNLGAQKQVVGGGMYEEGSGFALGVERLILSRK